MHVNTSLIKVGGGGGYFEVKEQIKVITFTMSNTILGEHWQSICMHTTTVTCVLFYEDVLCFYEWEVYETFEHTEVLMHIFFKRIPCQRLNFSLVILPLSVKTKNSIL